MRTSVKLIYILEKTNIVKRKTQVQKKNYSSMIRMIITHRKHLFMLETYNMLYCSNDSYSRVIALRKR